MKLFYLFKLDSCQFLLFPVCKTASCTCPFNQRSCENRCVIVSEVVSLLRYSPEEMSSLTPPSSAFIYISSYCASMILCQLCY